MCGLLLRILTETTTACHAARLRDLRRRRPPTIDLSGLVPPLPLGAPTVSGKTLIWSISPENSFDAGFGGLRARLGVHGPR